MAFEKDGVQYWSSVKAPFRSNQHYWKDLAWNCLLYTSMCHTVGNGDNDRLIHLVRYDQADSGCTGRSSFHFVLLLSGLRKRSASHG